MCCESPSCYTELHPKARKEHRCCECHGIIHIGEVYRKITGIWDGSAATYKQCPDCEKLFDEAVFANDGEPLGIGSLWEDCSFQRGDWREKWDAIAKKRGNLTVAESDAKRAKEREERIAEFERQHGGDTK